MKHSLFASLLTLATVSLHATAAVVDYVSGTPISSSGYCQYHTKWVTTTCYETITKSKDCSYNDGGDFVENYETVSPQVHPGPDYNNYNTVYETVYETAYPYPYPYPYPYETAQPYPHDPVCYPETVYSTVYPESSDNIYHTFTASGTDETITGSPIYHTMDSTIFETVTATATPTPSGDSGSECSTGPWIKDSGFEDSSWPGVWFTSGPVDRVSPGDTIDFSTWVARFTPGGEARLEQAIIIPNGWQVLLVLETRGHGNSDAPYVLTISLGSYVSRVITVDNTGWFDIPVNFGPFSGPSECTPVVFSIKATYDGSVDSSFCDIDTLTLRIRS